MTGNEHFQYALDALGDRRNSPEAAATLALAYEQRTANLIAVFGNMMDGEVDTFLGERVDRYELAKTICDRLGL